jgi:hypothetical protein
MSNHSASSSHASKANSRQANNGELLNCLRTKSLGDILAAQRAVRPPTHLSGFGPAMDGIVLSPLTGNAKLEHSSFALPLLLGFSSLDVRPEDTQSLHFGHDSMLKVLVRNLYTYHLQVTFRLH